MISWDRLIPCGVNLVNVLKGRKHQKRIAELRNRLVRHFEDSQRRRSGAYAASLTNLVSDGIIRDEEREEAREVLTKLVADGFLTYDSGSYYLHGRNLRLRYP